MFKINVNCDECKSKEVYKYSNGFIICSDCGLVLKETYSIPKISDDILLYDKQLKLEHLEYMEKLFNSL